VVKVWPRRVRLFCLVLVGFSLSLAACGRKEQAAVQGQVVARIGDEVVTVPELENEFRLANVPADKQKDPAIVRQILSEIVTRKYLEQKAIKAKLDREPTVLLEMLRARSQVLASAYLGRAAAAKPLNQAEVDKYVANNPFKFDKRVVFSTDQITFGLMPGYQSVVDRAKDAKTLEEVDQILTTAGVAHNRASGGFTSADIPEDFLKLIEEKKQDNVFFIRAGLKGIFFKVLDETSSPLTGEAARNFARQALRADRLKAEMGIATFSAGLEAKYEGDYASIMKDVSSGRALSGEPKQ
jgi:EpsD family peptidyl-prolyl cis-trans isomerase